MVWSAIFLVCATYPHFIRLFFFSHQIGAFLGVWWGGRDYVVSGSYDTVWLAAVGLALFAAVIHLPIRELPVLQRLPAEAPRG